MKRKVTKKFIINHIFEQYLSCIKTVANNLYKFDNLPDTINTMQISDCLSTGLCAIYNFPKSVNNINNGWVCCVAYGVGVERENGTFSEYELCTNTGCITVKEDECFIIRNGYNKIDTDSILRRVAMNLTEIAISERKLVKYARSSPILKTNSFNKNAFTEIVNNIYDVGTDINVMTDDSFLYSDSNKTKDDTIINVTDPNAISQMHFLSEYFTECIRRTSMFFGIPFRSNSKSSQSLQMELHDMDILSQFFNYSVMECIKNDIEKGNKLTGLNITVDYSDIMKKQLKELEMSDNNADVRISDRQPDSVTKDSINKSDNSNDNME